MGEATGGGFRVTQRICACDYMDLDGGLPNVKQGNTFNDQRQMLNIKKWIKVRLFWLM